MSKLTRESALRIITSKGIISGPGVHRVKVTSVTPFLKIRSGGVKQVAIANFNAKTAYHEETAITLFGQGDFDEAANQGLSLSILDNQFCPVPGQVVDVVVEMRTTSNNITGLFVTSCSPAPVEQPKRRSMEDFLRLAEGHNMTDQINVLSDKPMVDSEMPAPFGG